jgi:cysteinyl-tRNA synthetase
MKVYNSLTFRKEEFKPLAPKKVKMYVCGPTVYDSPHLGHAKSAVAFDIIHRYLKFKGYDVTIVKNYTDIDDKIIKRSNELGMDFKQLGMKYIHEYEEIIKKLNIEKVSFTPKATEVVPSIITFINGLIEKGHAYVNNESVYFAVKTFPKYNSILQNIKNNEALEEEADYLGDQDTSFGDDKQDPRDFALWKKSKENEPYWESPWGKGRPGWHIECSTMVLKFLGETIDIHGGGQDLKFPHHRNEIAQSESFTGKPFVKYFLHNGFINIDDEKMSKSLGNFFLASEILERFDPMVVRWFLISSHYRSSGNYSMNNMEQAQREYERLINTIRQVNEAGTSNKDAKAINILLNKLETTKQSIIKAMDDDFDTPVAVSHIFTYFRELNRVILQEGIMITEEFKDAFDKFIADMDKIFGTFPDLEQRITNVSLKNGAQQLVNDLVGVLVEIRTKLRKKKLYDLSDEIREKLRFLGINIEDKS